VHGLTKRFGATLALADVDLTVDEGSVLALLGPNGAGKTTLVRILTTLLAPDAGRATVAGFDAVRDAGRLRPLIGLAGQAAAVDEMLTGRENLELVGRLYHVEKAERRRRTDEVLDRFSLTGAADRLVRTYSGGMRRRLDLGACLIGRTPVLILDEPTTGLDPRSRLELWDFITERASAGTTVLLTTQYLEEADHLADRIVVIDRGMKMAEGTSDDLKKQTGGDVIQARLDGSDLDLVNSLIAGLGDGPAQVDRREQLISLPTRGGVAALVAVGKRLDEAKVPVAELGLRRPSLDDVFLALTGHADAAGPGAGPAAAGPAGSDARQATPPPTPAAAPGGDGHASARPPASGRLSAAAGDVRAITWQNLLRISRSPRLLMLSIISPITLLLMFRYFLGGAIIVSGSSYAEYLLPGLFVAAVLVGGGGTAIGIAQDLKSGIVDRFRSMPIARIAVLAGRTIADECRNLVALAAIVGLGLAMGFRFHNNTAQIVGGIALIAVFGYAFTWLYAAIGILLKEPEASYGVATLVMFLPLLASSAFVPVATMPGWLQPAARVQPVTVTINAVRALMTGGPLHGWLWQSLIWCVAIGIGSAALAGRQYRRMSS
jgi:ABC-2 type transport system ATP-binding protein